MPAVTVAVSFFLVVAGAANSARISISVMGILYLITL